MHWTLSRTHQHVNTFASSTRAWKILNATRFKMFAADHSTASLGTLPFQGSLRDMDRVPTLDELYRQLAESMQSVQAFKEANPHVENLQKLSNRIKRDLLFVARQKELIVESSLQQTGLDRRHTGVQQVANDFEQWGGLKESRLQGIVNNLRGFHGELLALHEAPGVVAVCKKFSTLPPNIWAPRCNIDQKPASNGSGASQSAAGVSEAKQGPPAAECWGSQLADDSDSGSDSSEISGSPPSASSMCDIDAIKHAELLRKCQQHSTSRHSPTLATAESIARSAGGGSSVSAEAAADGVASAADPVIVEVDVVANNGLTWIEVKNQELFGIDSVHFTGSSHAKGLAQQVTDLRAVAAAPVNSRRWCSPEVVVYFPSGVSHEVAAALRELGARVAVGPGSLSSLPVAKPPSITNLDVTSLCALVSEVSWGDPRSEALQTWAARTVHWQECLAAQVSQPLLPVLHACLDNSQTLVTSCMAVQQFQKLMDMFSGPKERQRWQELLERVAVYHCCSQSNQGNDQDCMPSVCSCCGANVAAEGRAISSSGITPSPPGVTAAADFAGEQQVGKCNGSSSSSGDACQQYYQGSLVYSEPPRIQGIDKLGQHQRAVFGLGDALQALTLTANGNAVRCCEQYGVKLDVVIHRPVWLTGI